MTEMPLRDYHVGLVRGYLLGTTADRQILHAFEAIADGYASRAGDLIGVEEMQREAERELATPPPEPELSIVKKPRMVADVDSSPGVEPAGPAPDNARVWKASEDAPPDVEVRREQARARGDKAFLGKPCRRCGNMQRYVSNKQCVDCNRESVRKAAARRKAKASPVAVSDTDSEVAAAPREAKRSPAEKVWRHEEESRLRLIYPTAPKHVLAEVFDCDFTQVIQPKAESLGLKRAV